MGETTKTINLDVTDDLIPEPTESFTVELSGAINAMIDKPVGTGTIIDNDLPTLTIDDPKVTEGNPGGSDATITFTVTRDGDNGAASTVDYTVVPGSATFPEDYNDSLEPLTGTLTFATGETSRTITLDITDAVDLGKDNVIAVQVDSRERNDNPPCGGVVDYLTYGGIYRDVSLEVSEAVYIADVFVQPKTTSLKAFGSQTPRRENPVSVDQVIPFPALSEVMVGLTVEALAAAEILDPDAPISRYLPGPSSTFGRATLRQLLSHTGGLDDARVRPG